MHNRVIRQGEIWLVDFGQNAVGHEYKKRRPAVVVQSDSERVKSNLVSVVPITSNPRNGGNDIPILRDEMNMSISDSLIKVSDIMTFDKLPFGYKIGEIPNELLQQIKDYLLLHFDL